MVVANNSFYNRRGMAMLEKRGKYKCRRKLSFIEKKSNTLTAEGIINFCRKHLAGFKVPKKIIFDTLPRTSTGKIQKYNLRKLITKNHDKV